MKLIAGRYRYANAHDMYERLGTRNLPAEGAPRAICDCGHHIAIGRMHQHKCEAA